jgi:hypothetical protein
MALQRKNPIPPGRYWIWAGQERNRIAEMEDWLRRNKDAVDVEKREAKGDVALLNIPPDTVFYIFVVKSPGIIFPQRSVGIPNVADATIKTRDDTAKLTPRATPADSPAIAKEVAKAIAENTLPTFELGGGLLLLALVWFFSRGK